MGVNQFRELGAQAIESRGCVMHREAEGFVSIVVVEDGLFARSIEHEDVLESQNLAVILEPILEEPNLVPSHQEELEHCVCGSFGGFGSMGFRHQSDRGMVTGAI